jgi:hypothetical protein
LEIEGGVVSGVFNLESSGVGNAGQETMKNITQKFDSSQPAAETAVYLFDHWFDPIEAGVRERVREFIQTTVESELCGGLRQCQVDRGRG